MGGTSTSIRHPVSNTSPAAKPVSVCRLVRVLFRAEDRPIIRPRGCKAMTIRDLMEMIERILTPEFPELIASLRPPATEAQIARVEAIIGRTLPEDYKELYRLHDGQSDDNGLFFGPGFIDLEWVERYWRSLDEFYRDETLWELDLDCISVPDGWIQERYNSPGWIPFASNNDGNFL